MHEIALESVAENEPDSSQFDVGTDLLDQCKK